MTCPSFEGYFSSCDFGTPTQPIPIQPLIDIGAVLAVVIAGVMLALFSLWLVMILRSE